MYLSDCHSNFSRYKGFPSDRRFMIEEDTITSKHPITFIIVSRYPHRIQFRYSIGASRMHCWCFIVSCLWPIVIHSSIKFGCRRLVKSRSFLQSYHPDSFKQSQCSEGIGIRSVFGHIKTYMYVWLCCKIVYLIRLYFPDKLDEIWTISHISIMQK